MLQRAFQQAIEQIRCNRSVAYHLRSDLKDKDTTLDVDSGALSKNNNNILKLEDRLSELSLAAGLDSVSTVFIFNFE